MGSNTALVDKFFYITKLESQSVEKISGTGKTPLIFRDHKMVKASSNFPNHWT